MAATTLPEAKPRQLQIARLRREEEEETWISGEELYTEGSSDDEGHISQAIPQSIATSTSSTSTTCQLYRQLLERRISAPAHLHKWQTTPKEASEPVLRDEPHLTETTRRFSQMGVELQSPHIQETDNTEGAKKDKRKEEVEEQEEVMLWRPKRGSLKLPRLDLESTPSRTSEQKVTG